MAVLNSVLDTLTAERFAALALACVHREFPNKISHALNSREDVKSPHELTPAFFGCYDWHSAVHNHWVLVRLARLFPAAPFTSHAKRALNQTLTSANITQEVRYLNADGRESFERPYGLAWLLQLAAELQEWGTPEAIEWSANLAPLEHSVTSRLATWLSKLNRLVRTGEHTNTAFALGLMLDYARITKKADFENLLKDRITHFFLADKNCAVPYEPSGEDFLSPCLAEADLVRRILPRAEFPSWLARLLPDIHFTSTAIADDSDGKLGHLTGLDLSRAWMLAGIASALAPDHPQRVHFLQLANTLKESGLSRMDTEQYHGAHWLGSFAVYLLTGRSQTTISGIQ